MAKRVFRLWFAVVASACLFLLSGTAQTGEPMSKKELTETIEKVRTGATSTIRDEAAQHLAELTRGINPKDIDDKTITDLVSLLDLREARYWVAVSLGNLGSRAKTAIPKLQQVLAEEDCLRVSKSAAGAIRHALAQMGVKPPPPKCETTGK